LCNFFFGCRSWGEKRSEKRKELIGFIDDTVRLQSPDTQSGTNVTKTANSKPQQTQPKNTERGRRSALDNVYALLIVIFFVDRSGEQLRR
jgi:hypothetical protein